MLCREFGHSPRALTPAAATAVVACSPAFVSFFSLPSPYPPPNTHNVRKTDIFTYVPNHKTSLAVPKGLSCPPKNFRGRAHIGTSAGRLYLDILPDFIPAVNISVRVPGKFCPSVDYPSWSKPVRLFVPRFASSKGYRNRFPGERPGLRPLLQRPEMAAAALTGAPSCGKDGPRFRVRASRTTSRRQTIFTLD